MTMEPASVCSLSEGLTVGARGVPETAESASRNSFSIPTSQNDGDRFGFDRRCRHGPTQARRERVLFVGHGAG